MGPCARSKLDLDARFQPCARSKLDLDARFQPCATSKLDLVQGRQVPCGPCDWCARYRAAYLGQGACKVPARSNQWPPGRQQLRGCWSHFQPIVDRSSLWSAEQGKYNSPYPRTCLVDLVSRERFDSLSRVSLLILHA